MWFLSNIVRNRDHHHFYHWKIHISRFTPEKNHIKKRFQSSSFQTPKSRSSSIQTRSISSTRTNSRFSLGNATKNILRNPNAPSHIPSENGGRGSSFAVRRNSQKWSARFPTLRGGNFGCSAMLALVSRVLPSFCREIPSILRAAACSARRPFASVACTMRRARIF